MNINKADLLAGTTLALLGAVVLYIVQDYTLGDARRMGPGYLPMLIGGLLVVVGALMVLLSLRGVATGLPHVEWRAVGPIILSIAGFIAGLSLGGLLPAILITLVLSSFADRATGWRDVAVLSVVVPVAVWLIFIAGLGIPIPFLEVGF